MDTRKMYLNYLALWRSIHHLLLQMMQSESIHVKFYKNMLYQYASTETDAKE